MPTRVALLAVAAVLSASAPVSGATFVVTNTGDAGPGSLRQAIDAANANPGPDTITFNIAGAGPFTILVSGVRLTTTDPVTIDGSTQPLYAGQPLIEIVGQLHVLGGNSTIRGISIHSPAIDPFGTRGEDLILGRDPGSTVEPVNGGNVVQGCYIGVRPDGVTRGSNVRRAGIVITSPGNLIGGPAAAERNVISGNGQDGIIIVPASPVVPDGNTIQGNYIGTTADGASGLGNGGDGIRILGASNNLIGGVLAGGGNVISGNGGAGVRLEVRAGVGASNENVIQGNFVGTDATGLAAVPNGVDGIILRPGDFPSHEIANNLIGGTTPGAGNVISGNRQGGIWIGYGNATGNLIQGNLIGLAADGVGALGNGLEGNVPPIPHSDGIFFEGPGAGTPTSGPHDNVVGGLAGGAGNRIAFNAGSGIALAEGFNNLITGNEIHANGHAGVLLGFLGQRTAIRGNSIHDNGNLGIDILDAGPAEGPTVNDACDGDTGLGNNRQNFPELTSAARVGATTLVRGTLNSAPNATFTLELFSNPAADPSGFGEGRQVLGTATVTTGSTCVADFTNGIPVPVPVQAGHYVSATATDADGNTSEFSATVQAVAVTQPTTTTLQAAPNPAAVGQTVQLTATVTGQGPTGTVDFLEGGTVLGSGQLIAGSAGLSTSTLTAGNHSIVAHYRGDTGNDPSDSAPLTVRILDPADLSVTKAAAPNPVAPGGLITYTITILNNGPARATGVVFDDTLPPGTTFVSLSGFPPNFGTACFQSPTTLRCTAPDLATGESITLTVGVTAPSTPGTIVNTVRVSAAPFDPNAANNTATAATTVASIGVEPSPFTPVYTEGASYRISTGPIGTMGPVFTEGASYAIGRPAGAGLLAPIYTEGASYEVSSTPRSRFTPVYTSGASYRVQQLNTAVGGNITVLLPGGVSVTFSQVSGAGATNVTPLGGNDLGPLPPSFIPFGNLAFDLSTTATATPPMTVGLTVPSVGDPQVFAQLRILHREGGQFVDRTALPSDFGRRAVRAQVSSLSPFVVGLFAAPPSTSDPLAVKRDVLTRLETLRSTLPDRVDADALDSAIRWLGDSVAPNLWIDRIHVVTSTGLKVFGLELACVTALRAFTLQAPAAGASEARDLTRRIVLADRSIAAAAIEQAVAFKGRMKSIDEARKALAQGDAAAATGRSAEAILYFADTWLRAVNALIVRQQ